MNAQKIARFCFECNRYVQLLPVFEHSSIMSTHNYFLGRQKMGPAQEQAQDELREALERTEILLRQEHHTQDGGKEVSRL